jgi:hypothetical protein
VLQGWEADATSLDHVQWFLSFVMMGFGIISDAELPGSFAR